MSIKKKIFGKMVVIEVRHKKIKTDNLTNIALIAQHYLEEVDLVEFCKVKLNIKNKVCYLVAWTEGPVTLIRLFLEKYFPLWRWDVDD